MELNERPTPETDAAIIDELDVELEAAGRGHWRGDTKMELLSADFARKLERERDEARAQYQTTHILANSLAKTQVELKAERDEAREQLRLANIDCFAALTELDAAREALREISAADWKTSGELRGMARKALEAAK